MQSTITYVWNFFADLNWGNVPTWGTFCVALYAAHAWRRQLKRQRGDELIAAAHNLKGAVYKALALIDYGKSPAGLFGERISEAYAAGRELNCCLHVAKRYYKCKLGKWNGDEVVEWIDNAKEFGKSYYALDETKRKDDLSSYCAKAKLIKDNFEGLIQDLGF
jgi:hypothetical protein